MAQDAITTKHADAFKMLIQMDSARAPMSEADSVVVF
jgi:hypothetical protein